MICDKVDFGILVPSGNLGVSSMGNVTVNVDGRSDSNWTSKANGPGSWTEQTIENGGTKVTYF